MAMRPPDPPVSIANGHCCEPWPVSFSWADGGFDPHPALVLLRHPRTLPSISCPAPKKTAWQSRGRERVEGGVQWRRHCGNLERRVCMCVCLYGPLQARAAAGHTPIYRRGPRGHGQSEGLNTSWVGACALNCIFQRHLNMQCLEINMQHIQTLFKNLCDKWCPLRAGSYKCVFAF